MSKKVLRRKELCEIIWKYIVEPTLSKHEPLIDNNELVGVMTSTFIYRLPYLVIH